MGGREKERFFVGIDEPRQVVLDRRQQVRRDLDVAAAGV